MTPMVVPAIISICKYSRHLYVLIQREQGNKSSSQSIQVIRWTFEVHFENIALGLELDDEDEDDDDVVFGCCKGIILTGRVVVVVRMDNDDDSSATRSVKLGDAYVISMRTTGALNHIILSTPAQKSRKRYPTKKKKRTKFVVLKPGPIAVASLSQ